MASVVGRYKLNDMYFIVSGIILLFCVFISWAFFDRIIGLCRDLLPMHYAQLKKLLEMQIGCHLSRRTRRKRYTNFLYQSIIIRYTSNLLFLLAKFYLIREFLLVGELEA